MTDRIAIVTGAAQGIGRAVAERLYEEGMCVVVADVDGEAAEAIAAGIGPEDRVLGLECDVSEKLDVRNLLAATLNAFGDVHVLVNNAGIVGGGDFLELTEDDFDRVLRVNLKGAFLLSQAVARHMVERVKEGDKPGTIVNMSSINAVFALPSQVPYSLSKAGISQLTRVCALSLAPHGIRVNAVGPGSIDTAMLASVNRDPAAKRMVLSRTPMGRIGEPSEIASIVAFLASDEASYMTGQTVYADGGRMPLNYVMPSS
ncbi:glucose 1-dehydrogenase [Acuticoccus sp. MNP-M23]|nr:glucose 1-dehydrogenase [Acuticoccus sp. MNP-M23]WMS45088.1 glucose 1-dehydrogenase [Acuticoccus sp. MNP-M23]